MGRSCGNWPQAIGGLNDNLCRWNELNWRLCGREEIRFKFTGIGGSSSSEARDLGFCFCTRNLHTIKDCSFIVFGFYCSPKCKMNTMAVMDDVEEDDNCCGKFAKKKLELT